MEEIKPNPAPPNDSNATALLAILWVTLAPAITLVCMRMYTKVRVHHHVHWDDYLICVGLVISIYAAVLNHLQVRNGFGRHIYYLNADQVSQVLKWSTLAEMANEIAVVFVKTSICLFILRMLSGTHRSVRIAVWTTIIIFVVITAVAVITLGVQCTPFEGVWNKAMNPRCISSEVVTQITRAYGVLSVITDFITASLPVFILQALQMNPRTKIALCMIMALGFFTAAMSIGKTVTTNFVTADITHDLLVVEIFSILEDQLGIIVASVPALRQLFVWSRESTSAHHTSTYPQNHTFKSTTMVEPSAVRGKNSTSVENLIPLGALPVRKTTEVEVEYSDTMDRGDRLARRNSS